MGKTQEQIKKVCENACDDFCEYRSRCGSKRDVCYCDEVRKMGCCPLGKLHENASKEEI